MATDDLSTPLGQRKSRTPARAIPWAPIAAVALTLPVIVFAGWAMFTSDPLGGEPMSIAPATASADVAAAQDTPLPPPAQPGATDPGAQPAATPPGQPAASPSGQPSGPRGQPARPGATTNDKTKTVTIIDGTSGKRRDIMIPATPDGQPAAPPPAGRPAASEQRFTEPSRHGPLPKIALDGTRPADAFARPIGPPPPGAKPDAPRIALVVSGLGVGGSVTADAMRKLPGTVTFAFAPYGSDLARQVARARDGGHEVMLQIPMEPIDYPDNDPGPHTLLTSIDAKDNLERLLWLMSRFQGYVGLVNFMGGRFTASEQSLAVVLREAAARGLLYLDDGSSRRSMANQIAGANNLAFAKADLVIDQVPTPSEVDRALGRLETAARSRGVAIGVAGPLPVSIERIAQWIKAAESRGIQFVPITAVVARAKSS